MQMTLLFIFATFLVRVKCALECGVGQYLQGEACRECKSTCDKCISEFLCTECKDGFFGEACTKNCSESCSDKRCIKETGACLSCSKGYYLKTACEKCPESCKECQNADQCTNCKTGYTGNICQKRCVNCKQGSGCSFVEGICKDGCKDGYSGHRCSEQCSSNCLSCDRIVANKCIACADGKYGSSCEKPCPKNCIDNICSKDTGTCTHGCQSRFWGDQCEYVCPVNCRDGKCLRSSGVCSDGCRGNFMGAKCLCPSTCDCYENGTCAKCDENTGHVCDKQCRSMCINNICSLNTERKCFYGCREGYSGSLCSPLITKPEEERQVWQIVVSIFVPAAVIIFSCVVVTVCIKRRRLVNRRGFIEGTTAQCLPPADITELRSLPENQKENPYDKIKNVESGFFETSTTHLADGARDEERNKLLTLSSSHETGSEEASHKDSFGCRLTVEDVPEKETRQQLKPSKVSLRTKIPLKKLENLTEDDILNEFKRLSASTECKELDETNLYELLKSPSLPKEYQDSLNACYINGYKKTEAYIACAYPRVEEKTVFWSMVWDEGCDRIVMLSDNVGEKDEQYWPESGDSFKCGDITVKCRSDDDFEDDFVRRELVIKKETEERVVLQQHFKAWPLDLVPRSVSSFTEFQKYRDSSTSDKVVPVVVHCSDGIGRTGTYIAFDSLTQEGRATGSVDIFSFVKRLREQRSIPHGLKKQGRTMVHTYEQYSFLYKALQCWYKQDRQRNKKCLVVPRQTVDSSYEPVEAVEPPNPFGMYSLLDALEIQKLEV